jgi:hypothetical protein
LTVRGCVGASLSRAELTRRGDASVPMLLFQKRFHSGLLSGAVRLTFRRWQKPHVRPGGRYRCHPIGVLQVDRIDRVRAADLTEADAVLAGFGSRQEMLAFITSGPGGALGPEDTLWRVELHHAGEADRVDLALDDTLGPEDISAIRTRLDRFGDWPLPTLRLIGRHPRVAASKLAARMKRETAPFKVDVRKLKRLGLTQSFEVGYALTPRGRAFLDSLGRAGGDGGGRRRRKPLARR